MKASSETLFSHTVAGILPSSTTDDLSERWRALLTATLETTFHQLLYVRRLYPRSAFQSTRFQGVRCQECRHPVVASYIHDFVKTASQALLKNLADEIIFSIVDRQAPVERYRFAVAELQKEIACNDNSDAEKAAVVDCMERCMRDLILQIHSISIDDMPWSSTATFQLSLHVRSAPNDTTSPRLHKALNKGSWSTSSTDRPPTTIYPLYTCNLPVGSLELSQEIIPPRQNM